MKFLVKLLLHVVSNALAIFVAAKLLSGITFDVTVMNLLKAGALLGIANAIVRPILKLFSLPLIILTLGLFVVIINAIVLWLVSAAFDFFTIDGFIAAILGVLIISVVNYIISFFIKD